MHLKIASIDKALQFSLVNASHAHNRQWKRQYFVSGKLCFLQWKWNVSFHSCNWIETQRISGNGVIACTCTWLHYDLYTVEGIKYLYNMHAAQTVWSASKFVYCLPVNDAYLTWTRTLTYVASTLTCNQMECDWWSSWFAPFAGTARSRCFWFRPSNCVVLITVDSHFGWVSNVQSVILPFVTYKATMRCIVFFESINFPFNSFRVQLCRNAAMAQSKRRWRRTLAGLVWTRTS